MRPSIGGAVGVEHHTPDARGYRNPLSEAVVNATSRRYLRRCTKVLCVLGAAAFVMLLMLRSCSGQGELARGRILGVETRYEDGQKYYLIHRASWGKIVTEAVPADD